MEIPSYLAAAAERIDPPEDDFESDRVFWVPLASVPALVGRRDSTSGTTPAALLYVIACWHQAARHSRRRADVGVLAHSPDPGPR